MPALPQQNKISQVSAAKRTYRGLVVEMGDGYSQRTKDGINAVRVSWNIAWEGLTKTEMLAIKSVLDSVGTWDTMSWTAFDETSSKNWRQTLEATFSTQGGDVFTISTNITEEFE